MRFECTYAKRAHMEEYIRRDGYFRSPSSSERVSVRLKILKFELVFRGIISVQKSRKVPVEFFSWTFNTGKKHIGSRVQTLKYIDKKKYS